MIAVWVVVGVVGYFVLGVLTAAAATGLEAREYADDGSAGLAGALWPVAWLVFVPILVGWGSVRMFDRCGQRLAAVARKRP